MVKMTSEEQSKTKRMKRTEDSLRDLWDNIKHTNIWIIVVSEEEKKEKRHLIKPLAVMRICLEFSEGSYGRLDVVRAVKPQADISVPWRINTVVGRET